MKRNLHKLLAVVMALIPSALMAADEYEMPPIPQPSGSQTDAALTTIDVDQPTFTGGMTQPIYAPQFLGKSPSTGYSDPTIRFGWWGVSHSGSPVKVGEWQGLESSPFFDVDGITSNGDRTANFFVTGMDEEDTTAHLDWYGPALDAKVNYERFLHHLDHDPLTNMEVIPGDPGTYIGAHTDVNAGEDYAIRVQEFDARFKGHLTENIKWRLNLWGMRKEGERQADAMSHPCSAHICHIQSQKQRIDWLTTEIEPVIEGDFGPVSVEYSRTMRSFNASDQAVSRDGYAYPAEFEDLANHGPTTATQRQYGLVPDNYTQIDRLKVGIDITDNTDFYGLLYYGDTDNRHSGTHRTFNGWDVRLTNRSIDGVTIAPYAKGYKEKNEMPGYPFPETDIFHPGVVDASMRHPVDREKYAIGVKGRWDIGQRRYTSTGWALATGYEYSRIERDYVTFVGEQGDFVQPNSTTNLFYIGPEWRVSRSLDTYFRYKMLNTKWPLFGFRENQEFNPNDPDQSFDAAVNTNQPQHVDSFELGGTWMPSDYFMLNATVGVERASHYSQYADFDENNYPVFVSGWWAPTRKLSLSAGAGLYSNFITQDITIGTSHPVYHGPLERTTTSPWNYTGTTTLVTFGGTYAWTDRITLTAGAEFVRGLNRYNDPSIPGELEVPYIAGASDVVVQTCRVTAGVDYLLNDWSSVYFRYVYFDYEDKSFADTAMDPDPNSGTAHFLLGGFSATF